MYSIRVQTVLKSNVLNVAKMIDKANKKNKSPTLFINKALNPARFASVLVYQKLINK